MGTKIIHTGGRTDPTELHGTRENPAIQVLSHGEVTRTAVIDCGDFAILFNSSPRQVGGGFETSCRVLDAQHPALEPAKVGVGQTYVDRVEYIGNQGPARR